MSDSRMAVSVVVPSRNRQACLLRTLSDLNKQRYSPFDIIVVDQSDKPSIEVQALMARLRVGARYVKDEGRGAARGRNIGLSHATGDVILFLDDDVEIDETDFIAHHARTYRDRTIGAVCGRVIENTTSLQRFNSGPPRVLLPFCFVYGSGDRTTPAYVNNVKGGNMSVRAAVLREVGGFSEEFGQPCLYEETDVALKIVAAGYLIAFRPECAIRHLGVPAGGQRAESVAPATRFLAYRDRVLLFRNNCSHWALPLFLLANVALACRPLLQLNWRSALTAVQGLRDGCARYLKPRRI